MSNKLKRPFVFTCTGMSLDGKISNSKRECCPISADDNRDMLYDSRVRADAVMIGGKTLFYDDSSLTVKSRGRQLKRLKGGKTKEPVKVAVITDANKIKLGGDFLTKGQARKIIFTTSETNKKTIKILKKQGCKLFVFGQNKVDLKRALKQLYKLGIRSLMVEGGGELIFSLLRDNLVDEISLKIGDLIIGGRNSPTLVDGEGFKFGQSKKVNLIQIKRKGNCLILKYKVIK